MIRSSMYTARLRRYTSLRPLLLLVTGLTMVACAPPKKEVHPNPFNVDYVDLHPDRCPEEQRIYPRREGRSCPSGSLTDFTVKQLTDFGGRPRWSNDGKHIAFVEGEYAQAYEVDVATGVQTCLTCNFKHEGIYRVYYMNNGDYLLLSTEKFRNRSFNRFFSNAIYWMPADRSQPPKYLGEEHFEGIAVSRTSRKIAYATSAANTFSPSKMFVAEISANGELMNKQELALPFKGGERWRPFEAQDFFAGDSGLIFSHYAKPVQTYSYNFTTRELINQTKSAAHEEPEGLFPDDRFAAMESDRHIYNRDEPQYEQFINSDIYMLGIDGTGKKSYRLSHVARDPERWANNPNVSPDGCGVTYSIGVGPSTTSNLTGTFGGVQTIEFFQCKE